MPEKILYAVLNWGLGHATRSIPIIRQLNTSGKEVIIASSGLSFKLLEREFPNNTIIPFETKEISYSKEGKHFFSVLFKQIPALTSNYNNERNACKQICKQHTFDAIISDNCYGFYSEVIPSILICHQLNLLYPHNTFLEKLFNQNYIKSFKHFTQVWVPDTHNHLLSGKLSKRNLPNVNFIGIGSRLSKQPLEIKYTCAFILSGPEPQRTLLEEKIAQHAAYIDEPFVLVRGTDIPSNTQFSANVTVFSLTETATLNELMNASQYVCCRSGYTSLMDLVALGKQAILIPTPGQTEQEYLANYLADQHYFVHARQEDFDLKMCLIEAATTQPLEITSGYDFLRYLEG